MIGIDAEPVIAAMADAQPFSDLAVRQDPRPAVRRPAQRRTDLAVACDGIDDARPQSAAGDGRCLGDLRVELLNTQLERCRLSALRRAVTSTPQNECGTAATGNRAMWTALTRTIAACWPTLHIRRPRLILRTTSLTGQPQGPLRRTIRQRRASTLHDATASLAPNTSRSVRRSAPSLRSAPSSFSYVWSRTRGSSCVKSFEILVRSTPDSCSSRSCVRPSTRSIASARVTLEPFVCFTAHRMRLQAHVCQQENASKGTFLYASESR